MPDPVVRSGAKSSIDKFVTTVRKFYGQDYEPDRILDLGAFNGDNALALSKAFPSAHIYSWECHPSHLDILWKRVEHNNNITVVPHAAHEIDREVVTFNMSSNLSTSSSLFKPNPEYGKIQPMPMQPVEVVSRRIDDWAAEYEIDYIDLIWADIQGAELLALHGMGMLLDTVQAMQLEVEYNHVYLEQPLYPELKDFLSSRGFKVAEEWAGRKGWWGDAIFVKEESTDGLAPAEVT